MDHIAIIALLFEYQLRILTIIKAQLKLPHWLIGQLQADIGGNYTATSNAA